MDLGRKFPYAYSEICEIQELKIMCHFEHRNRGIHLNFFTLRSLQTLLRVYNLHQYICHV